MRTLHRNLAVLVLFGLALATPSFAFDANKLSSAMNRYAAVSEWMNMIMHPGMPKPWTNPQLPAKMQEMSDAQKAIQTEVNSLETEKDFKAARAICETFKMCSGVYRDVGYQVEMMINEREKFLQLHQ